MTKEPIRGVHGGEERRLFLTNPYGIRCHHVTKRGEKPYWEFHKYNHKQHRYPEDTECPYDWTVELYLNLPLEDMPLYINDTQYWKRTLSWWRLYVNR